MEKIIVDNTRQAAMAETPEERESYIDLTEQSIGTLVEQGVYNEVEANNLLNHTAIKYFTEREFVNPTDALKQLNDSDDKITKMLTAEARSVLQTHLKSAARKQAVSDIMVGLQEKYVDNPEKPTMKTVQGNHALS
jgi:hypothetical protein